MGVLMRGGGVGLKAPPCYCRPPLRLPIASSSNWNLLEGSPREQSVRKGKKDQGKLLGLVVYFVGGVTELCELGKVLSHERARSSP